MATEPGPAGRAPRPGRLSPALLAMRAGAALAPALSPGLSEALAELGGAAAYLLGAAARRGLAANLAAALGPDDPDLVALRTREAFRTQAANYLDLFRLPALALEQIERR